MRHVVAALLVALALQVAHLAEARRVVAVGDLHGDMAQTLSLLKATRVISFQPDWYKNELIERARRLVSSRSANKERAEVDASDLSPNMLYNKRGHIMAGSNPDSYHWSGGKTILVILGDIFNVGPDDLDIARFMMRIEKEASEAGGQLELVYGNHEIANLEGDYSGVHPWSFERSGGNKGRTHQLSMSTSLGRWLRTRPALFEYSGLIFLHGGLFPESVRAIKSALDPFKRKTFVADLNRAVTKALTSRDGRDKDDKLSEIILDVDYKSNGDKGPLLVHPLKECDKVREANSMLSGIQAQVVGHTPHDPPIYRFCDGALYALDFKMSKWKGGEGAAFAALEFMLTRNSTTDEPHWYAELVIPSVKELEEREEACGVSGPSVFLAIIMSIMAWELLRRVVLPRIAGRWSAARKAGGSVGDDGEQQALGDAPRGSGGRGSYGSLAAAA